MPGAIQWSVLPRLSLTMLSPGLEFRNWWPQPQTQTVLGSPPPTQTKGMGLDFIQSYIRFRKDHVTVFGNYLLRPEICGEGCGLWYESDVIQRTSGVAVAMVLKRNNTVAFPSSLSDLIPSQIQWKLTAV